MPTASVGTNSGNNSGFADRRVPQVAGLELLILLTSTTPTAAPGKSHSELIVEFGNGLYYLVYII